MNDTVQKRRLIIVSGLSGAGKSVVLHTLEDLDFYCIDNLPISLLFELTKQLNSANYDFPDQIGIGIDARNPEASLSKLSNNLSQLANDDIDTEIVFLSAEDEILKKRFSETRRKHPLSSDDIPLHKAISIERHLLKDLFDLADVHIDTSHTNVHDLRKVVIDKIGKHQHSVMSLQLLSFGFKHGAPHDADFVFDVRCLTNPYWNKELRQYSGKDNEIINFLKQQDSAIEMVADIERFLRRWLSSFEQSNRSYLTIAIGCTGGRHRSVFVAESVAESLADLQRPIIVTHRDM